MNDRFDIVVVGGGSAGLVSSGLLASFGARVALVEKDDLGGECLFTGCVPSKALIAAAAAWHARRRATDLGLPPAAPAEVDLAAVMARVRDAVDAVHSGPESLLNEGVQEVIFGTPRFLEPHTLEVAGRRLQARRFVICTGSRPLVPDLPGLGTAPFLTSRDLFDLDRLPPRLAVIGAGPIGCEMAQAFRRLGSAVTLIGRSPQLLPQDDADLTEALREQFVAEGIEVLLDAEATAVAGRDDGEVTVRVRQGDQDRHVTADRLLLCVGRRPNVEGLGLDRAGVLTTPRGIVVDRRLRTTARHVWALGDVTGLAPFSHMAEAQCRAVAAGIAFGWPARFADDQRIWATFTDPELARIGPDVATAHERHRRVRVLELDLGEIDRAQSEHRRRGRAKVIVAGWRGRVIGAHVLAPHAGELIQEWILARRHGLRIDQISNAVHVYPTWSMLNQRTADSRFRPWARSTGWRRWSRRLYRVMDTLRR